MPPLRYTFPKTKRIRSRIDFSAVFETGIRQSKGPLTAVAVPTQQKTARFGLSVSRRVGKAPRRNRIKRLLRESFRLMQYDFPKSYDIVLIVRPHEPLILAEYQRILSSLVVKVHQSWQARTPREE